MKRILIILFFMTATVNADWEWKDTQGRYTTIAIPADAPLAVRRMVFKLIAEIRFPNGETETTKEIIKAEFSKRFRKISDPSKLYYVWTENTVKQLKLTDARIQKIRDAAAAHGVVIIRGIKSERWQKLKGNDIEMIPATGP